ncbi:hypothetical protein DWY53_13065 [Phocaeicola vulgatus]|uniref:Uncharacterized protein n=1 Tax=Phocaeicola vulgatus TaxID=821 RepID=A0A395ULP2_PHOVU|nr:hypothetical protein DWY53_13065 [Phocaeicola vulgatus]
MQSSSEMKWKLSFFKGMVRLVVYGMCDFGELLIRFEWSYHSAILAIIFLANSKYEFRLICPLLIFILQ